MNPNLNLEQSITSVMDAMNVAGDQIAFAFLKNGLFDSTAGILLVIFFTLNIIYQIINMILGDGSQAMAKSVRALVVTVAIFFVFSSWGQINQWSKDIPNHLSEKVTDSVPSLAGKDATALVIDKYATSIFSMYKAAFPDSSSEERNTSMATSIMHAMQPWTMFIPDGEEGVGDTVGAGWIATIISLIIIIAAMGFVLFSLISFVFILNVGTMMLAVGMCIGPMLLPFIVFPAGDGPARAWVKYMFAACFYKVIAVIIAVLSLVTIDFVVEYSARASSKEDSIIFIAMIIFFYAALAAKMMGRADNIASAFAGSSTSIGDGASNIMGAISRMTSVTKSIGKDSKTIANSGAGKLTGAAAGVAGQASKGAFRAASSAVKSAVNPLPPRS